MSETTILPGLVYSNTLADILGLEHESVTSMKQPLLGAALDISVGVSGGHVCHLHVFISAHTDIRLPEADTSSSISAHVTQLPYSLIKNPNRELKGQLGEQITQLANRIIVRFGSGELESEVIASDDKQGSYVSLPLNDYNKNLFPGVSWLSAPINCALAADDSFDTVTAFFETNKSPEDMIINQIINPERMTVVDIPLSLFKGMKNELDLAFSKDNGNADKHIRMERFKIINE